MNTQKKLINFKKLRSLFVVALYLLSPISARAAALYSQDFESVPVGTSVFFPPGLNGSGVASGGGTTTYRFELEATSGVGSSKGLSLLFDGSRTSDYHIQFGSSVVGSDASPIGKGTVTDPSQIRISIDMKAVGTVSSTPVTIRAFQIDRNYEADRHVDANMDGDMTDSATVFRSTFPVSLTDDADFT